MGLPADGQRSWHARRVPQPETEPPLRPRWEDNRDRARAFAARWAGETDERREKDTFWNELLDVFGVQRRQVARFEALAQRYSTGGRGFIDLFWPGRLLAEHKTAGRSLDEAMRQAQDYLPGMDPEDVPKVLVACDFREFLVRDLDTGADERFPIASLPDRLELFGLLDGRDRRRYDSDEDANLEATARLARFHDALKTAGYPDHERRVLLTRVLFCLFADDAGIFPMGLFEDFLRLRTRQDGSDLGPQLAWLFQVLDTDPRARPASLPEDLRDFTYVNGGIFAERIGISACDAEMRSALIRCSEFNWQTISPAIFGSMFQNVMTPVERRNLGAHYTTEQNILRTIRPLFLDALEADLARADTRPRLRAFRDRLASLTFFDPACGCGNFLVIAYRELRRLETECLVRLRDLEARTGQRAAPGSGQLSVDVTIDSKVGVGQFHGIEVEEFPCRIAETAMHLADHLANQDLSAALGHYYARFPITDTAVIRNGNAIAVDWSDVLAPDACDYLLGNPPFVGMAWMSPQQQTDRNEAFAALAVRGSRTGRLDYVTAWYAKAFGYLHGNTRTRAAFVSTNSITQGEQARTLGPLMVASGLHIDFAHRTFAWTSEARGKANVHVVVIGFSAVPVTGPRRLFDYPDIRRDPVEQAARNINVYLADADDVTPAKRTVPLLPGLPHASKGSQPTDGKHLLVTEEQHAEVAADPVAVRYLRPYRQSTEMLYDVPRWCLWLEDAPPADLRNSPVLRERLAAVRDARLASPTASVRAQAATPYLFTQRRQPKGPYIAMPEASSGTRTYIPAVVYGPDVVAGNKLICWPTDDPWLLGMLQSRAYTLWVATLAGRLKNDYSMAPDLAYSTFPFPERTATGDRQVERAAQAVLDARAAHPGSSLADLYDPLGMPQDVLAAHRALDRLIDRQVGGRRRVVSDGDRLTALFARYQELVAAEQLVPAAAARPRRRR